MSFTQDALKEAVELQKQAMEKYKAAANSADNEDAKNEIKKIIETNNAQLETAQWILMAEENGYEGEEEAAPENGATKLAAGKCPFSGQFKEMGIDMENFDMSKFKDSMGS